MHDGVHYMTSCTTHQSLIYSCKTVSYERPKSLLYATLALLLSVELKEKMCSLLLKQSFNNIFVINKYLFRLTECTTCLQQVRAALVLFSILANTAVISLVNGVNLMFCS